jgi:protein SCO1
MNRCITLTIGALIVVAFAKPLAAQSGDEGGVDNRTFVADPVAAESGKKVFSARGCDACHTIGKGDLAGPDLAGLLDRRSTAWIKKWLQDPWNMVETDPIAKTLFKRYNELRMPDLNLSDKQVSALMHYIALQTKATQPGGAPGK